VLWLAQTGKHFGVLPSTLLHVEHGSQVALDFDLACSLELTRHENKRDSKRLELMIKGISAIMIESMGGDSSGLLESVDDEA
jgi:hypothetical protein